MAIRQLPFEKGEEFGIRNKAAKFSQKETADMLENIKNYLERKDILIVKSGRSYYDVTAYPEIFEEGDEFRVEDLTAIDRKQMSAPEPPKPAFEEPLVVEEKVNPLAELYHRTDEEETVDPQELLKALDRKTYYLHKVQIEELAVLCHEMRVETSAMVREIFDRGIRSIADGEKFEDGVKSFDPEQQFKSKQGDVGFDALYEEAKENLLKKGFTVRQNSFRKALK